MLGVNCDAKDGGYNEDIVLTMKIVKILLLELLLRLQILPTMYKTF